MKNLFSALFDLRNPRFDFAFGVLILTAFALACGGGAANSGDQSAGETKSPPPAYVGAWTGQDGSTLTIRNDNTGDYKSGNTTVSGAAVVVDEAAKEIRFAFFGVDSGKFKIDRAPASNQMTLNNTVYRRAKGFEATSNDNS